MPKPGDTEPKKGAETRGAPEIPKSDETLPVSVPEEKERKKVKIEKDTKGGIIKAKTSVKLGAVKKGVKQPGSQPASSPALPEKPKPVKLPTKLVLPIAEFLKHTENLDERKKFGSWRSGTLLEHSLINPQNWDHTTKEGLRQIYQDCKTSGINVNAPYYQTLFAVLNDAITKLGNSPIDDVKRSFLDPAKYREELSVKNPEFVHAYNHILWLKGELITYNNDKLKTLSQQTNLNSDQVSTTVTDFLKSNLDKFREAIRERDYPTAGMYVAGAWAIYHSLKQLKIIGEDSKGTKWLAYGLATYCGYTFAKNAGYDLLKIAGFRKPGFEVQGTPLQGLQNILMNDPKLSKQAKNLDYGILLSLSEVKLVHLQELLDKTNTTGIHFIHPKEFPNIFPDLAYEGSFEMGRGEKGLDDYTGMANTKLTPSQREYVRVGKQLYLIALSLKAAYDNTLKKDEKKTKYFGKSYEQILKTDDVLKLSKVRSFLGEVLDYAPPVVTGEKFLSKTKLIDKAHEYLSGVFGKNAKDTGFYLEHEHELSKYNHFAGKLRGFPVVFVLVGDKYRFYLRNNYGNIQQPGNNYSAEIPLKESKETPISTEVQKAVNAVNVRMNHLISYLDFGEQKKFEEPKYEDGQWKCKVTLPAAKDFDITAREAEAVLEPSADGKGVRLITDNGRIRINVQENIAKQFPVGFVLLHKVISQKEFHALQVFSNADRLKPGDVDKKNKTFTILIGTANTPVQFIYKNNKFEFAHPDRESELIKDPAFAREYIDALNANKDFALNATIEKLKKLIKGKPDNFFPHVWQKLTGKLATSPTSGGYLDFLSSSIPQYFSYTVLDTTKYEVLERLRRAIPTADNLDKVLKLQTQTLHDTNANLQAVYESLASADTNKWDRDQFMINILYPIRRGAKSSTYSDSRLDFEYKVYSLSKGLWDKSDFSRVSHDKAADLLKVFAHYTAHLDNHDYSYSVMDAVFKEKVDLDNLSSPPEQKFPSLPKEEDPGLRGHYIVNYLEYVKQEILTKMQGYQGNVIPPPDAAFWKDILEFDAWIKEKGKYTPLNALDNLPSFKHDPTNAHVIKNINGKNRFNLTELEEAVKREFDRGYANLKVHFGNKLNWRAIENYLYLKPKDRPDTHTPIGRLKAIKINGVLKSDLFDWANSLATLKKRSDQIKVIKQLVQQHLYKHIFEDPDKFFAKGLSTKAWILKNAPWVNKLIP